MNDLLDPGEIGIVGSTLCSCICGCETRRLAVYVGDRPAVCSMVEPHDVRGCLLICDSCARVWCLPCVVYYNTDLTERIATTPPPPISRLLRETVAVLAAATAAKRSGKPS